MSRKRTSIFAGDDPALLARMDAINSGVRMTKDGRLCRDRLPWGGLVGLAAEEACSCKDHCDYDKEHGDAAEA